MTELAENMETDLRNRLIQSFHNVAVVWGYELNSEKVFISADESEAASSWTSCLAVAPSHTS